MKLIVAAVMMLSMGFLAVSQIFGNMKNRALVEEHLKSAPIIMFSAILVLLADMLASGISLSLSVLAMDILPSVAAIWIAASSFSESRTAKWSVCISLIMNLALLVFHVWRISAHADNLSDKEAVMILSLTALCLLALFLSFLAGRMRNVKSIMKNGIVWAVVCLSVDMAYLCFILSAVAMVQVKCPLPGVMIMGGVILASGLRILTDSKFLVWRKQERIIIESMKITSLPSASDASRIDDVYKDLYERISAYFEAEKPFLDSELTINVVVKNLYSNKLYLSRAISQFTGRNFCQFVNYYRVMHSMDSFRANPDLRVHELATMSGFNSVVSFNMAFRLFMGENPSEWCRKEKSRLIKPEK